MTAANRPSPLSDTAPPKQKRLVLLVDDSAAQRRLLARLLKRGGYDVVEAANGAEALQLCERLAPDLVLSDWVMPEMTGLQFCAAFRQLSRPNYGYFVLLTSNADAHAITEGLQAGADDFLTKPVAPQELLARLAAGERILRIEEELRASNTQLRQALSQLSETQAAMERDLREARKLQQ
ncbi:response regulator, partial [Paracoccus sp. (in: a-proteobacteria)]